MTKSWNATPERGSLWGIRAGLWILNKFGYVVARLFLGPLILYFFVTGRRGRRASLEYLTLLHQRFPDAVAKPNCWHGLRHHYNFGVNILDRLWFWQGKTEKFKLTFQGRENIERDLEKGLLLVGSHIGSFDGMRAFSGDKNLKINVIMHRSHAEKINHVLNALNPNTDLRVFELESGDINRIFELKNRIDRGEMVAILADRLAPFGRQRTVSLPFLGRQALFPQNPWILASLLECPVYLVAGIQIGYRRYHIFSELLAEKVVIPRNNREEAVTGYLRRYVQRLEKLCRDYPYQWFNFFPYWNQQSDAEMDKP